MQRRREVGLWGQRDILHVHDFRESGIVRGGADHVRWAEASRIKDSVGGDDAAHVKIVAAARLVKTDQHERVTGNRLGTGIGEIAADGIRPITDVAVGERSSDDG